MNEDVGETGKAGSIRKGRALGILSSDILAMKLDLSLQTPHARNKSFCVPKTRTAPKGMVAQTMYGHAIRVSDKKKTLEVRAIKE